MSRILCSIIFLFAYTRASSVEPSIIEMSTFFSGVYSFVTKNPKALISEAMFNQIKKYQMDNLTFALEAISKYSNVRFVLLFVKVWEFYFYDKFEPSKAAKASRDIQILKIFLNFNFMLRTVVFRQYLNQKSRNVLSDKRFIRAIVCILKRVDQSDTIIKINLTGLDREYSLTTTEITEILYSFAKIIEDDFVKGFKKAAREFIIASYNYDGIIPDDFSEKTRITALFMACRYFNQSFDEDCHILIKVEDWHPMMLAFLIGIRFGCKTVDSLFYLCTNKKIMIDTLGALRRRFEKILAGCTFNSRSYLKFIIVHQPETRLSYYEAWLYKIYVKLFAYSTEFHFT
jgi:hypothetical protein